jgi:DNA-binding SARP family transcriptional activator
LPPAALVSERTRVQLCGRLSVELDGVQLAAALRGKQVPLLFAYLVLNRTRHVGREELIGALWPDQAPRSQDAALRTLLSRLRSVLGRSVLGGRDELMLELLEPAWVDVEAAALAVERAQHALQRGDARVAWALAQVPLNIAGRGLLPGLQVSWLEPRRRELEDVRLQALEVVGRAGLILGGTQLVSVERAARSLIEIEPYRESGYVLMMQALEAQGNVAEGLRVFEQLRTLLREELGTLPAPETMAAHERLLHPLRHSPARSAGAGPRPALPAIELPGELMARRTAPLVGRRRELDELDRRWRLTAEPAESTEPNGPNGPNGRIETTEPTEPAEAAEPTEPAEPAEPVERAVLLSGEPGIGKTRLIAEIARRAHESGGLVLFGRSPEETVVPFQPFLEALRHYVANMPASELRSSTREWGSELSRLVPELSHRIPDLPPPASGEPETERYRLFEAVVGLLAEISSYSPVLLVLDDLHWADRSSLLLLRHLARAPTPSRLLILGSYRSTESRSEGFGAALAELRRERLVTRLKVTGLGRADTEELVRVRTGVAPSHAFSQALYEETEGNPLFVEEIVRHLADAGVQPDRAGAWEMQRFGLPESVKEVISRRLERLDENAIEWLRVAAVIGRDFDLSLLESTVSLDEDAFLRALDEALAAGLVDESDAGSGHHSFSHALIRETLYDGMSTARRARIHRRVGDALEQAGPERHLSALAHHFTRAAQPHDAERAIRYALAAGAQATEMLAHEEAADHYARGLEVLERVEPEAVQRRCELMVLLGEAQVRSGERPLAWEILRRAAALAALLGDGESLARAAIGASRQYVQPPGVVDKELIGMLEQALAMTSEQRTVVRVRLLARLCGALYYSPRRQEMRDLSREATALATELEDPEALALAATARRRAYWDPAQLEQRLSDSTELLRHARQADDLELVLSGHAWLVVDLLELGDIVAVDVQIEAFTAGAQRLRQAMYLWSAAVWRAMRALLRGHLTLAEQLAAEALAVGAPGEEVAAFQYYAVQLLAVRREQLRMAELEGPMRELIRSNEQRPAWRAGLCLLLCETGRRDDARAEFELLAVHDFADFVQDGDWMIAMTLLADTCTDLGDARRAALLYELLAPHRSGNVVIGLAAACLGSAARYLGRLAATMGDRDQALEHLDAALKAHAALQAPVHLAHTQLDYARTLGPGPQADRLIESAADTAQRMGLRSLAARAAKLAIR